MSSEEPHTAMILGCGLVRSVAVPPHAPTATTTSLFLANEIAWYRQYTFGTDTTHEGRRRELEELTGSFTDAFNRDDLDAVMAFFADDAVYDEFNGRQSRGKTEIRDAFVPQFRGDFGRIRFVVEDLFVDAGSDKALVRWLCTLEADGRSRAWRGLDVLHFAGRLISEKHTYAKAAVPLLGEAGMGRK